MKKLTIYACLLGFLFSGFGISLLARAQEDSLAIPPSKYGVRVERSVMVPMRDGVRLSTDVYFPKGAGEKLPVILIRTPYDKSRKRDQKCGHFFSGQGYVVVVQDCRGKYESEGEYLVSAADVEDGYDAVTWAATQPWSNGNVGTFGCSYLGENQIMQAKLRNSHLKAMIPMAAGGAVGSAGGLYRLFGNYYGGVLELASTFGWFFEDGSKVYFRPPPELSRSELLEVRKFFNRAPKLPNVNFEEIWWSLPVIDMMKRAGGPSTDFEDVVSHEVADPWWNQFGYITDSDCFDVPALHINSWYDFGVADTLYLFNLFQKNSESDLARNNQYVIISPTAHCSFEKATKNTIVGERDVGDARLNFWEMYVRWFDYWLKGVENGILEMPKVQIYIMGRNEWRGEYEWPLARTDYKKFYFHSNGFANSRFGTGTLSTIEPENEPADHYVYDPKTPVPSIGGPSCCTLSPDAPPGAFDQSEVEMRHDVLVYTSEVLKRGIEVTGPIHTVLYVSSSARDTDFLVKIVDVYPDGTAYNIQEGILRARYREGFQKKVWMKPNEVYEVKIYLYVTSNYFGPGHRIRLEVSSSSFPRFERNLNTGGNNYDENKWVIAKNTIHHSHKYPSHVVLPIIK